MPQSTASQAQTQHFEYGGVLLISLIADQTMTTGIDE